MVSFSDWQNIELRTAKIVTVEDVEGKDKLYKLTADLGREQRTLVAGLKAFYSKEDLEGKTIIVVANLEPAVIAGIKSEAMLLAVKGADKAYKVVTVDGEVEAGVKVE